MGSSLRVGAGTLEYPSTVKQTTFEQICKRN